MDSLVKRVENKVESEDIKDGEMRKVREAVGESLQEVEDSE